ncbi:MAG TPA: hypothetical protein VM364_01720 [Vicinamibacterales bacterium]|nr:hypothetical protein [Vicinamibacterales bacterium]
MFRGPGRVRLIGSVLALVLVAAAGATCLKAAAQTDAQRACCEAMAHDCGEMALEAACCLVEPQTDYARIAIAAVPLVLPTVNVADQLAAAAPAVRHWSARESSLVRPPGVPTYLFVSSFRI